MTWGPHEAPGHAAGPGRPGWAHSAREREGLGGGAGPGRLPTAQAGAGRGRGRRRRLEKEARAGEVRRGPGGDVRLGAGLAGGSGARRGGEAGPGGRAGAAKGGGRRAEGGGAGRSAARGGEQAAGLRGSGALEVGGAGPNRRLSRCPQVPGRSALAPPPPAPGPGERWRSPRRSGGARAPRPLDMVGHLHLQDMEDSLKEPGREGLLDSPDSGLPPSPSPSPPFYSLAPGILDARAGGSGASSEPPGPNEARAVRRLSCAQTGGRAGGVSRAAPPDALLQKQDGPPLPAPQRRRWPVTATLFSPKFPKKLAAGEARCRHLDPAPLRLRAGSPGQETQEFVSCLTQPSLGVDPDWTPPWRARKPCGQIGRLCSLRK
ncbi:hypothetical protein P7K49_020546 [Saguinus oedipus]|uniref:Uncharacterized protein n=1 Tax=Saguinus oedipus TaxID=9490 RepID=A0ABQ9V1K8_SAGOE|nr:hypothetical protein P7K49_020546 [Saguinus oedipus]